MERDDTRNEYIPLCTYSAEQLALQALVDRLFEESDREVFRILNKILQKEKES